MTSNTGTVRNVFQSPGELFPWVNTHTQDVLPKAASAYHWEVYEIELTGTAAAIGTDDYTFTAFYSPRAMVLATAFIVDPVGLSVDATNYNTFEVIQSSTTGLSITTAYGILPNIPREIAPAATIANRTLTAHEAVTVKVTGTVAGRIINYGTKVYIVCYWV
jgi:hypothetical protein